MYIFIMMYLLNVMRNLIHIYIPTIRFVFDNYIIM